MVTPYPLATCSCCGGLLRFFVLRSGFRPESSLALCPEALRSLWAFLLLGRPCALSFLPCASESALPGSSPALCSKQHLPFLHFFAAIVRNTPLMCRAKPWGCVFRLIGRAALVSPV